MSPIRLSFAQNRASVGLVNVHTNRAYLRYALQVKIEVFTRLVLAAPIRYYVVSVRGYLNSFRTVVVKFSNPS